MSEGAALLQTTFEIRFVLYFLGVVFLYSVLLIDFLLTVKAATLIFLSERGKAISSAKQWKSVLFIIW